MVKESNRLSDQWELPGGGLEFGEDPRLGLEREIREETNIEVISVSSRPIYVWTTNLATSHKMSQFNSLVLAYQIRLANLNFSITDECEDMSFFSKKDLAGLNIFHQSAKLRTLYDPCDFDRSLFQ